MALVPQTTTDKGALPVAFSGDQVDLIKRTIAKGATDDELKLFLYTCEKRGLDPLAKQIYFQKRRSSKGEDNITIITGIDGYRLAADRTGKYAGNDDPIFDDEQNPRKATVTVYKLIGGVRCPFTCSARWDQYYPGDSLGFMWRKMPHLMLGKCAEALALRKAFPQELSGLYIKEEMEQAGEPLKIADEPRAEPKPVKQAKQVTYDNESPEQQAALAGVLTKKKIDPSLHEAIGEALHGKSKLELDNVIAEVLSRI